MVAIRSLLPSAVRRRRAVLLTAILAAAVVTAATVLMAVRWGTAGLLAGLLVGTALAVAVLGAAFAAVTSWTLSRLRDVDARIARDRDERDRRIARIERRLDGITADSAKQLVTQGAALAEAGRLEDAVATYERAVDLRGEDEQLREAHRGVLRELHASEDATRRWIAAIRHQIRVGQLEHARSLAEDAFVASPRSLRVRDLLVGLQEREGATGAALDLARETAQRRIRRLERLRPPIDETRSLGREQRIFVAGYFYSGSGALLDHLRGLEGVAAWPPAGELRLIKFPGGFGDLAADHARSGRLQDQALVDLYLHLTGWKVRDPGDGYDEWGVINRNSRRLFRMGATTAGYLSTCLQLFTELADDRAATATSEEFEALLRRWLQRALDAAATDNDADHLVINQGITAWRLELARFAPPSTFVLVHRDPRDQFCEVREVLAQPGRSSLRRDPEQFAIRYRHDREAAERAIPALEQQGHQVLQVAFEDLVVDHVRQAARLAARLGLEGRAVVERRFRPEESRANVGKHRGRIDDHHRDVLCAQLPEYLHPDADG